MFCNKCGSQIDDHASFCYTCGAPTTQQQNTTSYQQNTNPYQQNANPYQQNANPYQQNANPYQQSANPYQQNVNPYQQNVNPYDAQYQTPNGYQSANMNPRPAMSMGWFNFMIYFGLFAGAVWNVIQGIIFLTGALPQYEGAADLLYAFIDGLEAVDKITGILCIALAVLAIVTRFRLSGYKRNATTMVTALYAGVIVVELIYIIGVYAVLPSGADFECTSDIISMCYSVAMLIVNIIYFNNIKHLFTK